MGPSNSDCQSLSSVQAVTGRENGTTSQGRGRGTAQGRGRGMARAEDEVLYGIEDAVHQSM